MAKQKEVPKNKKVLSFFMLGFPTVIIIALGGATIWAYIVQMLLAIYQFILIKQFLDDYYEVI